MTTLPQPKAEIVVEVASDKILWIVTSSPDAASWIESQAIRFGSLYPPEHCDHYDLFVSSAYDTDEVARYLRTGGGS